MRSSTLVVLVLMMTACDASSAGHHDSAEVTSPDVPDGVDAVAVDAPDGVDTPSPIPRTCERSQIALASGQTVWTEADTFDAEGRRTRTTHTAVDATRASDETIDFMYDEAGLMVEERHDEGANGTVDWTDRWTFDAHGRWVGRIKSWPTWKVRAEREYDANGHLVSERVDDFDDGRWDLLAIEEWQADRRARRIEDSPGVIPARAIITYVYDEAGREVRAEKHYPDNDELDSVTTRAYDAAGRLIEVAWRDPDGTWVEGSTVERDADGRATRVVWDSTLDGVETLTYTYDAAGNLVATDLAYGREPVPATRWTATAGCRATSPW